MRILLISTYDLGRQPFGLASPVAWLRAEGHTVATADLSREPLPIEAVRAADWIAFHLPMHTATRMAIPRIQAARELNPAARICCYGLYAPVNQEMLRSLGVVHVIGGEFESAYRGSPLLRFGGGTNEVMRDVVAQRGHGMPSYGRSR